MLDLLNLPSLYNQSTKDYEINQQNRRNIIAVIISDMNKQQANRTTNDVNQFIRSTYWFNPFLLCKTNGINVLKLLLHTKHIVLMCKKPLIKKLILSFSNLV